MTTLTLEIKDNSILQSVITLLSSVKWIKIKEENFKEYTEFEKWLIRSIKDINSFNRWEKEFDNAKDFLKTL